MLAMLRADFTQVCTLNAANSVIINRLSSWNCNRGGYGMGYVAWGMQKIPVAFGLVGCERHCEALWLIWRSLGVGKDRREERGRAEAEPGALGTTGDAPHARAGFRSKPSLVSPALCH